jgi:hypothetical protein
VKGKARGQSQQDDSELIRLLIARLAEGGPDAIRLRRALSETVANERHDETDSTPQMTGSGHRR